VCFLVMRHRVAHSGSEIYSPGVARLGVADVRSRDYTGGMDALPADPSSLPPFTNMRARCARCGVRREIRVHFDRDCAEVHGDHFHRLCRCGHRWLERCGDGPNVAEDD